MLLGFIIPYLDKTNICGFLSETLTADVETIFADETSFVGADSAGKVKN
jgi:hypothetical protein